MQFYRGIILNPSEKHSIEIIKDGLLVINKGKILYCGKFQDSISQFPGAKIKKEKTGIILPGLIDLHTHLPQYPAIGKGQDSLLPWLNNTIFPVEKKFNNLNYAELLSRRFFQNLIANGTTTAVIFSNSNFEATDIAFGEAYKSGIRTFIGNSLMDINSPADLKLTYKENIFNMMKLIEKWHLYDNGRLNFIVSPRYAGSCSLKLMKEVARIARKYDLFLQTHLAENQEEINFIQSTHHFEGTYTELLDYCGILDSKTLLAHCIYLSVNELELIKNHKSGIIHCPTSNRYLHSGIMPLKKYLENSLNVGIGTDIAGGYNFSMLKESREAIENSKYYKLFIDNDAKILDKQEALWLSTLGNAKILNLDSVIGNLSPGKDADFLIINYEADITIMNIELDSILSSLFYSDNYSIQQVYVRGKKVN